MATNWSTQNKASSTDNWSIALLTKTSQGSREWELATHNWEDSTLSWGWTTWTFSGKSTTRDSD